MNHSHSIEELGDDYSHAEEIAEDNPQVAFERPIINHYGEPIELLIEVPICDNHEPLVDVFAVCPDLVWRTESPKYDLPRSGLAREGLAHRLKTAQQLLPRGFKLEIIGIFRPFEIQKQMYEAARAEISSLHPEWDDDFLTQYVNVFSAPPIWETPPPHTTGGAVDLTILDASGEPLDMISPFEMGWDSAPMEVDGLSEIARKNRALLRDVLLEAGLTNFAGEWWHWSYGEPGWALRGGHQCALYGAVPETQIPDWQPPTATMNPE